MDVIHLSLVVAISNVYVIQVIVTLIQALLAVVMEYANVILDTVHVIFNLVVVVIPIVVVMEYVHVMDLPAAVIRETALPIQVAHVIENVQKIVHLIIVK